MSIQDSIADMLTRIRNALRARHRTAIIPLSKLNKAIAQVLKDNGYIADFAVENEKGKKQGLMVTLNYQGNRPVIQRMRRISKSSLRVYKSYKQLAKVEGGIGGQVLSTPNGILMDDEARRRKVGGEVLFEII